MAKKKKLKSRKSIVRRFKLTRTGKVLRRSSFSRHLRRKKKKKAIRRLKVTKTLEGKVATKVKKLLAQRTRKQKQKKTISEKENES